MRKLFEILSAKHCQIMLSKHVNVEQIIHLMKHTSGMSYFSPLFIEGKRHISGTGFSYNKQGESIRLNRFMYCAPDPVYYRQWNKRKTEYSWHHNRPIWELEFSYIADKRYFQESIASEIATDSMPSEREYLDSEEDRPLDAWYEDSEIAVRVISCEDKRKFMTDIEAAVHQFGAMKSQIMTLDRWDEKGLEVVIKCQCGNTYKASTIEFSSRKLPPDIFDIENSLRCSRCNEKGQAALIPTYRFREGFFSPAQSAYYSRKRMDLGQLGPSSYNPIELYDALGGSGVSDVYLADGTFISPSGDLVEDKK